MATEEEIGKKLNKTLVKYIDDEVERLYAEGKKVYSHSPDETFPVEHGIERKVVDYVKKEDDKVLDALMRLSGFLDFGNNNDGKLEDTYEIPGVIIRQNGQEQEITLYVPVKKAKQLANMASYLEDHLSIKLPVQLHQLKNAYDTSFIPGTTTPLPRPKYYDESEEDYENYLKLVYDGNVPPVREDDLFREPYAHEKVDYRVNDQMVGDNQPVPSAYYNTQVALAAARNLGGPNNGRTQNNPIQSGQRLQVNESEDIEKTPLGQKIGRGLSSFEAFFKNGAMWKKILASAAVLGIGGTAVVGTAMVNPALLATTIVSGAVIGGSIILSKKIKKRITPKINNWLYGAPLTNTEEQEQSQERRPTPQPERSQERRPTAPAEQNPEQSTSQPEQDPEQLHKPTSPFQLRQKTEPTQEQVASQETQTDADLIDGWLKTLGEDMDGYRDLEQQIEVAKQEMNMGLTEAARLDAKQRLDRLKSLQKKYLIHLSDMISDMANSFAYVGGRSL